MLGLAALAWIPYFLQSSDGIPNDGSYRQAILSWGSSSELPASVVQVTASGDELQKYTSDFKLQAVANLGFRGDRLDAPFLFRSAVFDIVRGPIRLTIERTQNSTGVNLALLMIPNGVDPSKYSTIRQMQSAGAKFLWAGSVGNLPRSP